MLADKVAVITNSTSGVGLAIAKQLAAQGAHLIIHGEGQPEEIEKTRINLALQHDVSVSHIAADFTSTENVQKFIDQAAQLGGSIDILVNHTDLSLVKTLADQLALGILATHTTATYVLAAMQKKGWGRIINVVSSQSESSECVLSNAAVQQGVVGFTQALGAQNKNTAITSNVVTYAQEVEAEQVGGAVLFLCSAATENMTGRVLALGEG